MVRDMTNYHDRCKMSRLGQIRNVAIHLKQCEILLAPHDWCRCTLIEDCTLQTIGSSIGHTLRCLVAFHLLWPQELAVNL